MAPSGQISLAQLHQSAKSAENAFSKASFFLHALCVMLGIVAGANLAIFIWVNSAPTHLGASLLWAIAALSAWTIGMRYVDRLEEEFLRREKAIDEYLNLPVS